MQYNSSIRENTSPLKSSPKNSLSATTSHKITSSTFKDLQSRVQTPLMVATSKNLINLIRMFQTSNTQLVDYTRLRIRTTSLGCSPGPYLMIQGWIWEQNQAKIVTCTRWWGVSWWDRKGLRRSLWCSRIVKSRMIAWPLKKTSKMPNTSSHTTKLKRINFLLIKTLKIII